MWPVGPNNMTDDIDTAWQSFLGDKSYMMGISPWFYTDLPQYSKTWTWRGTGLWDERWKAAAALKPKFVEIITWNGKTSRYSYFPGVNKLNIFL